jgi:hypothetical protein
MRIWWLSLICALAMACGAHAKAQDSSLAGDPIQVTSTDRLAWTQQADNPAAIQSYIYIVYVDGVRSTLENVRCRDTPGVGGFECSASLPRMSPGRHVLNLATSDGSVESERSPDLVVNVTSESVMSSASASSAPASSLSRTCIAGSADDCYKVQVLANSLRLVHSLAPLPDGRLLFVEGNRRVLMLSDNGFTEALTATSSERIVAMAAAPDFTTSHLVFMAQVSPDTSGGRLLTIVRAREVAGRLGELATLVGNLLLTTETLPALTIGPDRSLYVAIPSARNGRSGAYDGFILRFTTDGVAAGNLRAASPILARGTARPGAIGWGRNTQLWLSALDRPVSSALSIVPLDSQSGQWPETPLRVPFAARADASGVRGLAFVRGRDLVEEGSTAYLLTNDPRKLYTAAITDGAVSSTTLVPLGDLQPAAVAIAADGAILIAATSGSAADFSEASYSLVRLRRNIEPAFRR